MNEELFEQIKLFLPKYLTPEQTRELFSELESFPNNHNFYLQNSDLKDQLLQGDGWHGFIAINFQTLERKEVSGIILSNSCDVDPDNERNLPVSVLFSPLIKLSRYEDMLSRAGQSDQQIDSVLTSIRAQKVTSVFYLPSAQFGPEEGIILLDDIHSHPLQDFISKEPSCLFTLSQYAFYIFLIKLSIHFSRFQEDVARFSP